MPRSLPAGLVALLLAVASSGATAPSPTEVPAAARTTVQLLGAGITHTDGTVTQAGLGELRLLATRDGEPFAALEAVGARAGDERAFEWTATTHRSDERSGELSADFPSAAGMSGGLHLGDYLVRALGTEASSSVSAIDGALGLPPLDLTVDNVGPALATSVTDTSASTTSLTVGTVELTLGDLLPPGLIDHLPLGLVLDLLDRLPVTVPTVEDLVALVEQLVADLTDVAAAEAALDAARAELNELVGDAPGIADAEDAVAAAEDALAEATASRDEALADREIARAVLIDAEAALADALADAADQQQALQDAVDDAEQVLADAQAALTAAEGEEAAAQQTVETLTADLEDVRDHIATLEAELATLDPVLDALRIEEIEDELDSLEAQESQLEADLTAAQQDLADATAAVTAAGSDVADAEAAVADAEAALADAVSAVAEARAAVDAAEADAADADAAVAAARAAIDSAEAALAEATAELDALVDQAAETLGDTAIELRDELTRVRGELQDLLDRVSSHAAALPDLASLLDELRDGLAGVPVVTLGGVSFDVALHAGADAATAKVDCTLDDITVFGQTLASPRCADAGELLGTVPGELAALMDGLPIDELPLPRVAGLSVRTDATPTPDEDGITRATATVTALALEVPAVPLTGMADELTRRLDGLLADALAAARALSEADAVTGAVKRFTPMSVLTTLQGLRSQVDGLPLGSQLDGRRTLGVDVTVGHLVAEVLHGATAAGPLDLGSPYDDAPAPAPDDDPEGAPDPGDGDPGAPTVEPPSLPATGGGLGVFALALLGAALVLGRRRR